MRNRSRFIRVLKNRRLYYFLIYSIESCTCSKHSIHTVQTPVLVPGHLVVLLLLLLTQSEKPFSFFILQSHAIRAKNYRPIAPTKNIALIRRVIILNFLRAVRTSNRARKLVSHTARGKYRHGFIDGRRKSYRHSSRQKN